MSKKTSKTAQKIGRPKKAAAKAKTATATPKKKAATTASVKKAPVKAVAKKPSVKKAAPKKTTSKKAAAKTSKSVAVKSAPVKKKASLRSKTKAAPQKVSAATSSQPQAAAPKAPKAKAQPYNLFTTAQQAFPTMCGVGMPLSPFKEMEKLMSKSKTSYDNINAQMSGMVQESFESFMQSSTALAKGCEDIIRTSVSMVQSSAEKQHKMMQKIMNSKDISDISSASNEIAQNGMDDLMSNATKLSELSVRVLTESIDPINNQLSKGYAKFTEAMAA